MKILSKLFFISLIFLCFSCSENIDFAKINTGFVIEDKFVLGYGLDYEQYYRNLPYVAYVE